MDNNLYHRLEGLQTSGDGLSRQDCERILDINDLDTLELVGAAYHQRRVCLAAGRELYLRSVQPLVLQIVDGIFLNGYLNVSGDERDDVLEIAQQSGFSIAQEPR